VPTLDGTSIGFVGLGLMGKPMARNLCAAGATLTLYNRSAEPLDEFASAGMATFTSVRRLTGDTFIVMVRDSPAVEAVITGADGLLECVAPGTLVIDMSSTNLDVTKRMAEAIKAKGGDYLDAPVSGGKIGAAAGHLTIMVGGSADAFARALPIFEVLGENITLIGDVGAGQIAKAVNQVIVAMTIGAVAEGLSLAKRAGIDAAKVREALQGGFAASRIMDLHGIRMIESDFEPGGRCSVQHKDVVQALELAASVGIELPGLQANRLLWEKMLENGWENLDHSALIKVIEKP
jgi:3-hydroxyisobutyrate dehydrogenase-like beta-hydroxyacid dehydrogenase